MQLTQHTFRHLLPLLFSFSLLSASSAWADDHDHNHGSAYEVMNNYALVMGQNLPHLLRNVLEIQDKLGLTEEQKKAVADINQSIPKQMIAGFDKAKELELEIARAVIEQGSTSKDLAGKLNELQTLKRQLTELQIGALIGMKQLLTAAQYKQVLEKAEWKAHDDKAKTDDYEEHGAHEHGAATLSFVAGVDGLEIMLESPAANTVGFEHAASTDEDKKKLADAKAKLEAGADLFSINPEAECTLKSAEVISALLGNAEAAEKDAEIHNDMDVTWTFACAKPAELKEVTTKLFAAFPEGFQKITAEWVTDKGASAQELDKDATLKLN